MTSSKWSICTSGRMPLSVLVGVVVAGLALVPVAVAFAYVHEWGRDVPFWDEWERSARLAVLAADGTLTLDDVLRTHNEHRLLFSALITVASVHLTGWSLVDEMYVSVALSFVSYLLLVDIVRVQSLERRTVALLCVPLAMVVFWPAQWFNWLVGFQTQVYGFMAFSAAAVRAIVGHTRGWASLLAAAALANCAQFSQAGGVAIWPAVLVGLWMLGFRRAQLAVWLLIAVVSLGLFFRGYVIGEAAPAGIGSWCAFALAYLGGMFVGAFDDRLVVVSIAVAAAGLALFVWSLAVVIARDDGWSRAAPWTMLVLLGLGTAAMVARNRSQYGLSYALVPRYATQAGLVWLGLCGICGQVIDGRARRVAGGRWPVAVSALVLAVVVALYRPTQQTALSHGLVSDDNVRCLAQLPATGQFACLAGTHPAFDADFQDLAQREEVLRLASGLARHHLGVFAATALPATVAVAR